MEELQKESLTRALKSNKLDEYQRMYDTQWGEAIPQTSIEQEMDTVMTDAITDAFEARVSAAVDYDQHGPSKGDPTRPEKPTNKVPGENMPEMLHRVAKTHGKFADTAYTAQRIKTVIRDGLDARQERNQPQLNMMQIEALDMVATKIARILAGDATEYDHWLDIAGYATLPTGEF